MVHWIQWILLAVTLAGTYFAVQLTRHALNQVDSGQDSPTFWYTVAGVTGVVALALAAEAIHRLVHILRTRRRASDST